MHNLGRTILLATQAINTSMKTVKEELEKKLIRIYSETKKKCWNHKVRKEKGLSRLDLANNSRNELEGRLIFWPIIRGCNLPWGYVHFLANN